MTSAPGATLPPRFDWEDPQVIQDPYPRYAELRGAGSLCRFGPGQWGVTDHAHVSALLKDRRLGQEFPRSYYEYTAGSGAASDFFSRISILRDPPEHTRLRKLMNKSFTPAVMRRMGDHVACLVDGFLDLAAETGRIDAAAELAYLLPVTVICELLGVPTADHELIRTRAADLAQGWATLVPADERPALDAAVAWLRDYVTDLLPQREKRLGEDLLSQMLLAQEAGSALSRDEVVDNAVFLFFAGFETTRNAIGTGCFELATRQDELARLRADPGLAATAFDEILRWDAPVQGAGRLVLEPVEVDGRTLRPGRVVVLLLGSANRDPRAFPAPDRFDITRSPNPHVTFGGGPHFCLGAVLAKLEGTAVFERLARRFESIELAGPPVRRQGRGNIRGYSSVPLAVCPRR